MHKQNRVLPQGAGHHGKTAKKIIVVFKIYHPLRLIEFDLFQGT